MGAFTVTDVVLVKFPFSDLSTSKLRPAIILTLSGKSDYVLCQITSGNYEDKNALKVEKDDCIGGTLERTSYIRPFKIFTANEEIISRKICKVKKKKAQSLVEIICERFKQEFEINY